MDPQDRRALEGARTMITGAARVILAPPVAPLTVAQREHLEKAHGYLGDALRRLDLALSGGLTPGQIPANRPADESN